MKFDQILYDYVMSFVGLPYKWGGDDPMTGFDCSGLVLEFMYSAGIVPPGVDMSAQGLWYFLETKGVINSYGFGSLAFYGKSLSKISHVGFCLDTYRMVEAGSGNSQTKTIQDAIDQNAYVRIRPIKHRSDFLQVIKPNYGTIGFVG